MTWEARQMRRNIMHCVISAWVYIISVLGIKKKIPKILICPGMMLSVIILITILSCCVAQITKFPCQNHN